MKWIRLKRTLAVFAAVCLLSGAQGITALAGPGAAKPVQGGPGVVSRTEGEGEAGGEMMEQTEPAADQSQEGQPAADQGQAAADQGQAAADQTAADSPLQINYSALIASQGWSGITGDGQPCSGPAGTWMTALKANLISIPQEVQVGVRYQVNLSGSGWLDWAADGAETGDPSGNTPLEAVRMELTGAGGELYDIYYKVLQNGAWTAWAMNGAEAGIEGAGLRADGIRVSITAKGAPAPAENITGSIDPSRPMIALTFDDGPRAAVTNRILDSLQAHGGRATFFMLGANVSGNASVVQRMAAQGCEVANHTHDHKYLTKLGAEGIVSQTAAASQKIAAACGVAPTLMRPPGGYIDEGVLSVLQTIGMPAVMWSIDTRDWQHRNPQRTIEIVLSQVRDGDIILMHDIYGTTADAAEVLIPELTARGYQLVTVSELAAYRGGMAPGHKYSQFRP